MSSPALPSQSEEKLRLLGEISERARHLETEIPLDVRRNAIAQDLAWSARRTALVDEAAQALNWLLADALQEAGHS